MRLMGSRMGLKTSKERVPRSRRARRRRVADSAHMPKLGSKLHIYDRLRGRDLC